MFSPGVLKHSDEFRVSRDSRKALAGELPITLVPLGPQDPSRCIQGGSGNKPRALVGSPAFGMRNVAAERRGENATFQGIGGPALSLGAGTQESA